MQDYWHKQTKDQPLFADLLWSRPENRAHAGKLLIIGGNSWGFAAPATAYDEAVKAGIGSSRVLLPEAVHKVIGHVLQHAEAAPSNPSGSFSHKALAECIAQAAWADGVLIAGDLGRNSETAILLEKFLSKHPGQVTITKDAVDYAVAIAAQIVQRPQTTLVLSLGQLQKLATAARFEQAITSNMNILQLVEALHLFTLKHPTTIIVKQHQVLFTANMGQVSTTKLGEDMAVWRVKAAAHTSVWWLQNPAKSFEAMTVAVGQL